MTVLAPYRALLAACLFLCGLLCRRSLTLCQARDHGKSGSLIRSTALLPRSKLGTRHTPDDMYSPTRQPAKRCREPAAFAAADRGDRARRVRGDRHGEAAVIPYDAAGASARACGSVEGSTLGAAEVRRLHHSRTTPTRSGAVHMKTGRGCAFHMRRRALSYEGACTGACPRSTAPDREWCSSYKRGRCTGVAPRAPPPIGGGAVHKRGWCTGGVPRAPPRSGVVQFI